jgi:DNA primase
MNTSNISTTEENNSVKSESDYMNLIAKICHANLKNSDSVCDYLEGRGITEDCIDKYKIGFFPQSLGTLKRYVPEDYLLRKCILKSPYHSDFKDFQRLIIPIYNEHDEAVGIVGRCTSDINFKMLNIPKYKNSSFKKSNVLFGLNLAYEEILKKDRVFIVEGYLDHVAMTKNGIKECVALGGTAFSGGHLVKLLRLTNNLYFIYDSDESGQITASRVKEKYDSNILNMHFLKGPDDIKDVDEFFKKYKRADFGRKFKKFNP